MATAMENEFTVFLSKKLQDINADVDLDVFLPYLTVILETEDMEKEEMEESIQGFLAEITVNVFPNRFQFIACFYHDHGRMINVKFVIN